MNKPNRHERRAQRSQSRKAFGRKNVDKAKALPEKVLSAPCLRYMERLVVLMDERAASAESLSYEDAAKDEQLEEQWKEMTATEQAAVEELFLGKKR